MSSYLLKIKNLVKETDKAISISFDIPDEIKSEFNYKSGQFLTLKPKIDGKTYKRAYSISSSPTTDEDLTITVKAIDNGFVSNYLLNHLQINDLLEVQSPAGKFTFDFKAENQNEYVFFAGGSGITPVISLIKSALTIEPRSNIVLFYANRDENSIIFKQQLDYLEKKYYDRFKIVHILSRASDSYFGLRGRINKNKAFSLIKDYVKQPQSKATHYFLCGHQGMMNEILECLDNLKIIKENIHKESFTKLNVNGFVDKNKLNVNLDNNKIVRRKIRIKIYSESFDLFVEPDETILTAALRENLDPPFSCQIGACASCRAKLISGKVIMDERDALTDDEIEQGYILTCQSHPITDDVIVDYDD